MKPRAIFFDLLGTLLRLTEGGAVLNAALDLTQIATQGRLGVLTNVQGLIGPEALRTILSNVSLLRHFDPKLVIPAGVVGPGVPDPAAFRIAAAIAELPIEECTYVTCDSVLARAASAAGMSTQVVPFLPGAPVTGDLTGLAGLRSGATLLAGEVDEDTGPTFILKGRVVTMRNEDDVIANARVLIRKGKIVSVLTPGQPLPAAFSNAIEVDTGGTIYPGLMDLHNHFVYNVLPLWTVPRKYNNRGQWPRHVEYQTGVSRPIKQVLAAFSASSKAIARYVEAKALLGGTTTGQGIRTQLRGGSRLFRGAMRSVEDTADQRLPESRTMVPDLVVTGAGGPARVDAFRAALEQMVEDKASYFYHLAEGVDDSAHQHFLNLSDNNLIVSSLAAIHSLGLEKQDLKDLATEDAKVVWSPFSNMLLYGQTINLANLKASGVTFSIGCDWSPTGSKNLLQELKVAAFENKRQGNVFSDFELIQAVTSNAAKIAGWGGVLGTVRPGMFADLLVIKGVSGDAYKHLLKAVEKDVRLVTVHGVPRYGDLELLQEVVPDTGGEVEEWKVEGVSKGFYLFSESSGINDVTFTDAIQLLTEAMEDLKAFKTRMEKEKSRLQSLGVDEPEEFTLELDNEIEEVEADALIEYDTAGFEEPGLLAGDEFQNTIEFDLPFVNSEEYWERIDSQENIPAELKTVLKQAYGAN
jgi:cytosine/adenosine deaminase-related metal-dependent hydrolase